MHTAGKGLQRKVIRAIKERGFAQMNVKKSFGSMGKVKRGKKGE